MTFARSASFRILAVPYRANFGADFSREDFLKVGTKRLYVVAVRLGHASVRCPRKQIGGRSSRTRLAS